MIKGKVSIYELKTVLQQSEAQTKEESDGSLSHLKLF